MLPQESPAVKRHPQDRLTDLLSGLVRNLAAFNADALSVCEACHLLLV